MPLSADSFMRAVGLNPVIAEESRWCVLIEAVSQCRFALHKAL
jgi:hypothetical protein